MPFLDFLFGRKPRPSIHELAYGVAYYEFPQNAFAAKENLFKLWDDNPSYLSRYLYIKACRMRGVKAVDEESNQLSFELHDFSDTHTAHILKYPVPPSFEFDPGQMMAGNGPVLAPYYSALITDQSRSQLQYFVLGQSPSGGTTLRSVDENGINSNLGPGPDVPSCENFLGLIRVAICLLYTSPSPRDLSTSRMPSSA